MSFNLEEIGGDENTSLYCVTTFTKYCRSEDTGRNYSSGSWRLPNRTTVPSRVGRTAGTQVYIPVKYLMGQEI